MSHQEPPTLGAYIRERYFAQSGCDDAEIARKLGIGLSEWKDLLSGEVWISQEFAAVLAPRFGASANELLLAQHLRDEWDDLQAPPIHPGIYLRNNVLIPAGLSVDSMANLLGMSRIQLEPVLSGSAPLTPELAWRISLALDTNPQQWMAMQSLHDLIVSRRSLNLDSVGKIEFPDEEMTQDPA